MSKAIRKEDVIKYPKFYIKAVAGRFSLEHRLTHTYLETYETEKELIAGIKKWNALTDKELWCDLLYKKHARIPKKSTTVDKYFEYEEDWFIGAWGIYTTQFFRKYKKLLVVVEEVPLDLVNEIRREKNDRDNAKHKRMAEEREEAERNLREEEKLNSRKKEEPKRVSSIRIGDVEEVEKVAKKKKVIAKSKIKIRRKAGSSLKVPIVSVNPFD